MKKFTIFVLTLTISLLTLQSCQNNDPIIAETPDTQESIALRTALNQIKVANDISTGRITSSTRNASSDDFCFDFVYPIQLIYNNGSEVSVENFEGLLLILINESSALHIVGIAMPFEVLLNEDETVVSIANEQDFIELLSDCEVDVFDDDDMDTDCFEFAFPLEIIDSNNVTITVGSLTDLLELFEEENDLYEPNFVFPITVILANGDDLVIESLYDFAELLEECDDCDCPDSDLSVCVLDPITNDILEFDNECEALCEGFTPNNFVNCDGNDDCNIYDLEVSVGDCNPDGTYNLSIDFEYEYPGNVFFELFVRDNVFVGNYALTDLPITITNFSLSGFDDDYLSVSINDNDDCSEEIEWESPECENEIGFMDYVGECFDFVYPFEVVLDSVTYEVNSYAQLTQYFNANTFGAELIFPLEIINLTSSDTEEIESMEDLEDYLEEYCQ